MNKKRIFVFITPNQYCTESPGQSNKAGERSKRHTDRKEKK